MGKCWVRRFDYSLPRCCAQGFSGWSIYLCSNFRRSVARLAPSLDSFSLLSTTFKNAFSLNPSLRSPPQVQRTEADRIRAEAAEALLTPTLRSPSQSLSAVVDRFIGDFAVVSSPRTFETSRGTLHTIQTAPGSEQMMQEVVSHQATERKVQEPTALEDNESDCT